MRNPVQNEIYTAKQILEELNLKDSPFFRFRFNGQTQVIQTSHCGDGALLEVPGFAETRWQYEYTTSEWIPLFMFEDDDITSFVDMEQSTDPHVDSNRTLFVTPKGFPSEQDYRIEGNRLVSNYGGDYPLPEFDEHGDRIRA